MDPPSPPSLTTWLAGWRQRVPAWAWAPAALVVVAAVAVIAVTALRAPAGPAPRLTLPQAGAAGSGGAPAAGGAAGTATTAPAGMATVHAAGAVASPGIYAVPSGARVADVLTAAGGPLPEADIDRLNLAARVADGDRVYVLRKGETGEPSGAGGSPAVPGAVTTAAGPLDLNTATAEQLDTLPSVGPATAQAIITYRTRHGRFRSVTELLEVPGIGPAKLEAVRPLVRV